MEIAQLAVAAKVFELQQLFEIVPKLLKKILNDFYNSVNALALK